MNVYAPGRDQVGGSPTYSPSSGSGGTFAEWFQGATPKYAKNRGFRSDLFRDTLCRLMVRVTDEELTSLFTPSIADPHVRTQLVPNVAGDPRTARGYVDYLITRAHLPFSEKVQVAETLADNYIIYTFGQSAPTASFEGALINTVQDDQVTNFFRLYQEIFRASKLAQRQKAASIKIDSFIFTGVMTDLELSLAGNMETLVPFSFRFIIKRMAIVNYTVGWRPTGVGTPFATDLNAVPADVRLQTERPATAITFHIPTDTTEEGHPDVTSGVADPRIVSTPPQGDPGLQFVSTAPDGSRQVSMLVPGASYDNSSMNSQLQAWEQEHHWTADSATQQNPTPTSASATRPPAARSTPNPETLDRVDMGPRPGVRSDL